MEQVRISTILIATVGQQKILVKHTSGYVKRTVIELWIFELNVSSLPIT